MKKPNVKNIRIDYHAKKRFKDRYGIHFNHDMKMRLINKIWSGEAELIQKTSNARSMYRTEFDGVMIDFIFDRRRRKIITCLFPGEKNGSNIQND